MSNKRRHCKKKFDIGGDVVISLMKSANIPSHAGYKLYLFPRYTLEFLTSVRKMLHTVCEMDKEIPTNSHEDSLTPTVSDDNESEDSDPEMNLPLASLVKRKRPLVTTWRKTSVPNYKINKICSLKPPSKEAAECKTPVDFFHLFFTKNILGEIVRQSNLYALQKNKSLNLTLDENSEHFYYQGMENTPTSDCIGREKTMYPLFYVRVCV
jgi:hypothetical protein